MSNKNAKNQLETMQKNRTELTGVCLFLESKGLEFRESSLGVDRVQYYRGRDLKQIFDANKFEIAEMINKAINKDIGPKGSQSIENFYEL